MGHVTQLGVGTLDRAAETGQMSVGDVEIRRRLECDPECMYSYMDSWVHYFRSS